MCVHVLNLYYSIHECVYHDPANVLLYDQLNTNNIILLALPPGFSPFQ